MSHAESTQPIVIQVPGVMKFRVRVYLGVIGVQNLLLAYVVAFLTSSALVENSLALFLPDPLWAVGLAFTGVLCLVAGWRAMEHLSGWAVTGSSIVTAMMATALWIGFLQTGLFAIPILPLVLTCCLVRDLVIAATPLRSPFEGKAKKGV